MATAILVTKLHVPAPSPKLVTRPRLIERLNEGLAVGGKLALISAPAGFGKTTLMSEWGAGCGQPVAWLSLDEADNDPIGFLTYLVAALQTISATIGAGALAALQSPQRPVAESILTSLLNEIAVIPHPFILVLDDYHRIESEHIDQALTFLLDHLPPQMRLVIATREDPFLPLARLRARGHLIELRAADLQFTPVEAADFLNRMMGLSLSDTDIAALEARTEGWIAGLQLAALSMQGRSDTTGFIRAFTGSHRFVLDYLVEEVLLNQPEHIRNFLLQSAILERLCAPLCNVVTDREDSKVLLETLERSNLFLILLDDERQWYRYHHLFADVLQTRLIETQPEQVTSLHQRASEWYAQNGFPHEAIRHALANEDYGRAAGLIELVWPASEQESIQSARWLGWVKALPDDMVKSRPVLCVGYAYVLLANGELEAAEARLRDAERWLMGTDRPYLPPESPLVDMVVVDKEQYQSLAATIGVARAYIAQALGNIPDAVRYAGRVLELAPEGEQIRRGQASMLLGMAHWAGGDLEAANRVFADHTMKLRVAGNLPDAISTTTVLADIRLALGQLREAIGSVEQCLHFVINRGEPIPFDTADLHRVLSELYLEQDNQVAAAQHLHRSMELGEKAQLPVLRYRLCIAQTRLYASQGDLDGALASLVTAERLYIRSPLPDFRPISAMKARIWVAQGRLTPALAWARVQGLFPDNDLSYLREYEHITLARILIAQSQTVQKDGSIDAAVRFLDRLLQAAEEGGRMGSVIEILILHAIAYLAQGTETRALVALERALALAEPEGYVRIFVDEGEVMRILIEKQSCHRDYPLRDYADKLLAAFVQPVATPMSAPSHRESVMIEPLSERELEVLRLLRGELSGPEIARQLILSLNTVRTHTQNIYTKLGVNNRRAAVRRAEELELL